MFRFDPILKLWEENCKKVIATVFIASFLMAFISGTVIIMTTEFQTR